jgi:hypothetical protein
MTDNAEKKSCDVCNKSFQSEQELQEHRQTAHAQDRSEKRPASDQSQERPERREPKREEHVA